MMNEICDLCGLPLRGGVVEHHSLQKTYRFCCHGCKQVFVILSQSPDITDGDDFRSTALFKKCQAMGIIPTGAPPDNVEPSTSTPEGPAPDHVLSLQLYVAGMWCPACAWLVDETIGKTDGVFRSTCMFSTDTFRCDYDPTQTSPQQIIEKIKKMGYAARLASDRADRQKDRAELIRFGISAFLTMNVMMLSFSLYAGYLRPFSMESIYFISIPTFAMASGVFVYGGWRIHRRAWQAVTTGAYGMETLISLGAGAAFGYSLWGLLKGSLHLYFDTASMLVTLVLLGKMLETGAKRRVQEDLVQFLNLQPKKVRICTDQMPEGRYVSAEVLKPGDCFRLEEGEVGPADGMIVRGSGVVDESNLTGEPVPRSKKAGDRLVSGSQLSNGILYVRADHVGQDATLGQMIEQIEIALSQKTALEGQTDRLLRWFVPAVILLSMLTAVIGYATGLPLNDALTRAITVLVISCPCALGVAIPLTRVAGLSVAGTHGLLVRDFEAFENAGKLDRFVFDKTGTVTLGKWQLLSVRPVMPYTEAFVLSLAAGLEAGDDHLLAREIARYVTERNIRPALMGGIEAFENGRCGTYENKAIRIGARAFVLHEKMTASVPDVAITDHAAHSTVYLSVGDQLAAVFLFGDRIQPSASPAIGALYRKGYRLAMVSGDGKDTTRSVATQVGIESVWGEQLPQDKLHVIKGFQTAGERVAMVGDGINDAPALAQSDLAIAVNAGNPLGKETADVTLMRGELIQIVEFLNIAEKVRRKVRQNLTFTFVYNTISIPIAMTGLLSPPVAVCAMLMSSLSVIGNTLLLVRQRHLNIPAG